MSGNLPPLFFIIFFTVLVVLVSFVLWEWTQTMDFANKIMHQGSVARHASASPMAVERAQMILTATKTSAFHHARILASYLHGNTTTISSSTTLRTMFMSYLFLAISTIPYISHVSLIQKDGFSHTFRREGDRIVEFYSNATDRIWYEQPVAEDTGVAYGDPVQSKQREEALNVSEIMAEKNGFVFKSGMFIFAAPFPRRNFTREGSQIGAGVVSFGVSSDHVIGSLKLTGGEEEYFLVTADGQILAHRDSSGKFDTENNKIVVANSSCKLRENLLQRQRYGIHCSPITAIAGIRLVSVNQLPLEGEMVHFRKMGAVAMAALVLVLMMVAFGSCVMIQLTRLHQRREMFLSSSLVKQLEATRQAERKSMNKSLAFANATHDVRTSLAGITGLIEICRSDDATTAANPELNKNLDQMIVCSVKLLDILNSVLDISKVEAGKMQLDEIEFDMADVIEESVDLFHVVGLRKKLEVIWDPCDGSIFKEARIKGDVRRFKQILDNLLGNAVKFTSTGHVVLRGWAKRRHSNPKTPSNSNANSSDDCVELVFEVDDTGIGIPVEKRAAVFENYVQVKETSRFEGGTGLGLGIVQSYVRLMGGEIGILDKKMSQKGTCFRFNIILKSAPATAEKKKEQEEGEGEDQHHMIDALVFAQGQETRRISKSFMEGNGMRVLDVVNTPEQFQQKLEESVQTMMNQQGLLYRSTTGREIQQSSPCILRESFSRNNRTTAMTHLLIIVEAATHEVFKTTSTVVRNFTKNVQRNKYRIAWLLDADTSAETITSLQDGTTPCDATLRKPFHGSRLFQVLRIARELGQKSNLGDTIISITTNSSSPPPQAQKITQDKILAGINILLVEDMHILQLVATKLLSRLGANVTIAENGKVAVRLVEEGFSRFDRTVKSFPYRFILMDCEMPGMNGYEATKKIRAKEKEFGIHIPIIATSAHEWKEHGQRSIEAGMDFHITKPLQTHKLLDIVRNTNLLA